MSGCAARPAGASTPVQLLPHPLRRPPPRVEPVPWFHLVDGDLPHVLIVEQSAVYQLERPFFERLRSGDREAASELAALTGTLSEHPAAASLALPSGPLAHPSAISLNVAQSCNLACDYCYADEGRFHGTSRFMSFEVARGAVDDLLARATPGERVLVGFIGGEPLLNREVVHATVAYAARQASEAGTPIGFSMTTNGSLIDDADVELLRLYPFALTVSLDGDSGIHDRHRSNRHGHGSWTRIVRNMRPLLDAPGSCHISARATVTRDDLDIAGRVDALVAVGFREVGVSPARTGPEPSILVRPVDSGDYLAALIRAADAELDRLRTVGADDGWRFANLAMSLAQIHRGSVRPLPCGAAHSYMSVDVDGAYSTCHRSVGDSRFGIGSITDGPSEPDRRRFLEAALVDRHEPCRSCWARYLCGGGCHAEVADVGRDNCDLIRGWLDHCLQLYPAVLAEFPTLFAPR